MAYVPKVAITCERCGRTINKSQVSHFIACANVPKPADLTAIYKASSTVSVTDLSLEYGVSTGFIRQHLLDGGVTEAEITSRRHTLSAMNQERVRIPSGARKCYPCQILIYKDRPVGDPQRDCGGQCPECAGVGVKRVSEHEYDVVGMAW